VSEALCKAEHYFGHIPSGTAPDRVLPEPLPAVAEASRLDVAEDVPSPAIWFALRLPADSATGRELPAVGLASSILGEGDTSRLHRRLVRHDQTAMSAGLGLNALIAGNALGVGSVHAVPGQDLDEIAAAFDEVVSRFAAEGPTQLELDIARAQAERDWLDEMSTAAGRADALSSSALLFGDAEFLNQRLPLLQSLTAEEVQQAAQVWLTPAVNAQVRVVPSTSGQETERAGIAERADAAADPDSTGADV